METLQNYFLALPDQIGLDDSPESEENAEVPVGDLLGLLEVAQDPLPAPKVPTKGQPIPTDPEPPRPTTSEDQRTTTAKETVGPTEPGCEKSGAFPKAVQATNHRGRPRKASPDTWEEYWRKKASTPDLPATRPSRTALPARGVHRAGTTALLQVRPTRVLGAHVPQVRSRMEGKTPQQPGGSGKLGCREGHRRGATTDNLAERLTVTKYKVRGIPRLRHVGAHVTKKKMYYY